MNNERVTPKNAAKELQMDVITLRELMKREKLPIGYEEVVITGGEPMINPAQLYTVIKMLRKQNKRQKIYLYTACLTMDDHPVILKHLDGITVTVHAEATDEDIRNLKYMSSNLYDEDLDMRLFIDKRVYDRYDLSNICMKTWDVVRKLEWKEKCDPAENEELFLWNLY